MYYLSDDNLIEALKWYYLVIPPLVISLGASKISICLLLLRILDRTRNKFKRYFPYGIIVISVAVAVPSAGYTLGQCQPLKKLWNPSTPGHCQDPSKYVKFGYANGGQQPRLWVILQADEYSGQRSERLCLGFISDLVHQGPAPENRQESDFRCAHVLRRRVSYKKTANMPCADTRTVDVACLQSQEQSSLRD